MREVCDSTGSESGLERAMLAAARPEIRAGTEGPGVLTFPWGALPFRALSPRRAQKREGV